MSPVSARVIFELILGSQGIRHGLLDDIIQHSPSTDNKMRGPVDGDS